MQKKLRKRLAIVLAITLAATVALLQASAKGQLPAAEPENYVEAMSRPRGGQFEYAPDFELIFMNGESFRLADNIGKKVVVLNFFATWCGPCKREMPELSSYYEEHREDPFIIIGVDADEKEQKVQKLIDKYGVTFPVAIDEGKEVGKLFGVRSYPTTVLIGADGTVKLFDAGPIRDAASSFNTHLRESIELINSGGAIDKKTYLEKLGQQS